MHGCLSSGRNNYLLAFGEAMETSCNKDSLGSVGLDLQEFDGCGEQSLLGLAGNRRRKRQIGTDLDRNSPTERANRHCLEKLAQRKRVIFGKILRSAT